MSHQDQPPADPPEHPEPITPEAVEQAEDNTPEPAPEPITPEAFEQAEAAEEAEQQENINTPDEDEKPSASAVYIEREPPPAPPPAEPIATIPREIFNYMIIAVVFALVGGVVGYMLASSREINSQQLAQEVADAIAPRIQEAVVAAQPPSLDDPNSRFSVAASENRFTGADEGAAVTLIEFGDFNCGFCKRFVDETLPQLLETYGDRVRFTYRDYPILADSSLTAALAAHCAAEQGEFWEYHNILYANPGSFERDQLMTYAAQLELDSAAFSACLDEERYLDTVITDYREAQSLGIRGTPAFFINGRPISGAQPYQVFANMIEEELAAAGASEAEVETS